jgi:hypothetical protein
MINLIFIKQTFYTVVSKNLKSAFWFLFAETGVFSFGWPHPPKNQINTV